MGVAMVRSEWHRRFKHKRLDEFQSGGEIFVNGFSKHTAALTMQRNSRHTAPDWQMNPILLKSGGRRESDGAFLCSVVVMGKHYATEDYGDLGKGQQRSWNLCRRLTARLLRIRNL
jgi:cobyric acid synthase